MTTHRRPTMIDVADDAGVSLKTVSRVVNGVTTVDPALAERVMASVHKLGFRRNDLAATLRSGTETRTIALITADLQNPFYTPITAALAAVARSRGHQLITASSQEDPDVERATALDLCQRRVRALVVVPTAADHSYLAAEVASGIPVVFVDRPGDGVPADQVLLDDRGGADDAITDLVDRGHRRIAVLLDRASIHTMAERLAGVRQGLERAGLVVDPGLVSNDVHTPEDAVAVLRRMLAEPDPPTAVFCGNNLALIGAVEHSWLAGTPLVLSGFDDFLTSRLLPQPVTIVDHDAAEMGRIAGELVFDRLDGEDSAPRRILLPTSLVVRGGRPQRGRATNGIGVR